MRMRIRMRSDLRALSAMSLMFVLTLSLSEQEENELDADCGLMIFRATMNTTCGHSMMALQREGYSEVASYDHTIENLPDCKCDGFRQYRTAAKIILWLIFFFILCGGTYLEWKPSAGPSALDETEKIELSTTETLLKQEKPDSKGEAGESTSAKEALAKPEPIHTPKKPDPSTPKKLNPKLLAKMKQIGKSRNDLFNGVKVVMQLYIVLAHFWTPNVESWDWLLEPIQRFRYHGTYMITFYMILTGFFTHAGYGNKPLFQYFARRFIPVILIVGISLIIVSVLHWDFRFTNKSFWLTLFLLEDRSFIVQNMTLWNISLFAKCWLTFPILNEFVLQKFSLAKIWPTFLGISFTLVAFFNSPLTLHRHSIFAGIAEFFMGMLVSKTTREIPEMPKYLFYAPDLAFLALILCAIFTPCGQFPEGLTILLHKDQECRHSALHRLIEIPFTSCMATLVIFGCCVDPLSNGWSPLRRLLKSNVVQLFGQGATTFAVYVLQHPFEGLNHHKADFYFASSNSILYLPVLWISASLMSAYIYMPFSLWVRTASMKYFGKALDGWSKFGAHMFHLVLFAIALSFCNTCLLM